MSSIEETIDVDVPVREAYNQWTQFEEFPKFMEGVESITQTDDTHIHWKAEIAGDELEWDAEITEQIPDKQVAWKSTTGANHAGVVTFHHLDEGKSRVALQLDYEPEGAKEKIGDMLGIVKRRVKGDLERFKELIESKGSADGGWRGEVEQDAVPKDDAPASAGTGSTPA
jgi:uncharacterized membrane protein